MFSDIPVAVRAKKSQVVGRAYRRQPYFVRLAKMPADRTQPKGRSRLNGQDLALTHIYV